MPVLGLKTLKDKGDDCESYAMYLYYTPVEYIKYYTEYTDRIKNQQLRDYWLNCSTQELKTRITRVYNA